MEEYTKALTFWDDLLGSFEVEKIEEKIAIEPGFDAVMDEFASKCKVILDYGCGSGDLSFMAAQNPNVERVIGTDTSEKGIKLAAETASISNIDKITFQAGGIEILKDYPDNYFDGAITSNVLDVIPVDIALQIIAELHRVVKKSGLIFIKLNAYLKPGDESKFSLVRISGNMFGKNGILRVNNLTNGEWKNIWADCFEEKSYGEYPCLRPEVFDRVFLLNNK